MNHLWKKSLSATLIAAFILATLFLAGCGDSEMAKGITDVVKKSVEGEVAKKGADIKKQFDQVINLGTGKGEKEDGRGDAKASKERSEKDSSKESKKEND